MEDDKDEKNKNEKDKDEIINFTIDIYIII